MLNFEEEIRKFKPVAELEQAEDAIYSNDLKDVTEVLAEMLKELKEKQGNQQK